MKTLDWCVLFMWPSSKLVFFRSEGNMLLCSLLKPCAKYHWHSSTAMRPSASCRTSWILRVNRDSSCRKKHAKSSWDSSNLCIPLVFVTFCAMLAMLAMFPYLGFCCWLCSTLNSTTSHPKTRTRKTHHWCTFPPQWRHTEAHKNPDEPCCPHWTSSSGQGLSKRTRILSGIPIQL